MRAVYHCGRHTMRAAELTEKDRVEEKKTNISSLHIA